MTEPVGDAGAATEARSAGALLREARQARGMHIAALAAAIKVSPRKLEALEGDRYDELLDATFTRALAQTVCRALKIDAEPVLAKLPQTAEKGLQVGEGLNAPLRHRAVRRDSGDRSALSRPVVWGAVALLVAAVGLYFLPPGLIGTPLGGAAPEPAASAPAAASAPVSAAPASVAAVVAPPAPAVANAVPSAAPPASAPPAAKPEAAAAAGGSGLVVRAIGGPSWLEVQDAHGRMLIARTVEAGESVQLAGPVPLRVKIGNAAVTQVSFRGQPVTLSPREKNIARFELK